MTVIAATDDAHWPAVRLPGNCGVGDLVSVYDRASLMKWLPTRSVLSAHVLGSPHITDPGGEMTGLARKSLDAPEETRLFQDGKGKLELVNLESGAVGRATFEPGWQWSKHVKPIAQTESCQAAHMGYFVSGRMKVVMDDGEEMEFGPGDFAVMAPGHDAWTVGSEPCVVIDWQGFADYAKG
jgi:hypothetical protein